MKTSGDLQALDLFVIPPFDGCVWSESGAYITDGEWWSGLSRFRLKPVSSCMFIMHATCLRMLCNSCVSELCARVERRHAYQTIRRTLSYVVNVASKLTRRSWSGQAETKCQLFDCAVSHSHAGRNTSITRNGGWCDWKPSSSSNCSIRALRACPLIEIRQTAPCRAIRGNSISVNSTLPAS